MLKLPVSVGEAIDKLSILDIKVEKIKDPERNQHCRVEYDILYEQLKDIVTENKFYYDKLKEINESIWDMQDEVRTSTEDIGQKCIDILNMNDSRFRIKDILNRKAQSMIREQKGYPIKKVLVVPHQGLGDHVMMIGAIRYLSMVYDEVHVAVSQRAGRDNVKTFYSDNDKIKIIPMSVTDIFPFFNTQIEKELNVSSYTKVYRLGKNNRQYDHLPWGYSGALPYCWYEQMDLPQEFRTKYFYVPETSESLDLYSVLKDMKYIFIHRQTSDQLLDVITWNINDIVTIDPDYNLYEESHPWHSIAAQFVKKPFWHYYDTMRHANEIHLANSSFFCMAVYLKLNATKKRVHNRPAYIDKEFLKIWDE